MSEQTYRSLKFDAANEAITPIGRYWLIETYGDDSDDETWWEWMFEGPEDSRDSDFAFPDRDAAIEDAQKDYEHRVREEENPA